MGKKKEQKRTMAVKKKSPVPAKKKSPAIIKKKPKAAAGKKPPVAGKKKAGTVVKKKPTAPVVKKPAPPIRKKPVSHPPKKPAAPLPKKKVSQTPQKPTVSHPKKPATVRPKRPAAPVSKKPAIRTPPKPVLSQIKVPAAPRPPDFRGYLQVYTGNGKGKTTAALGLALRAAGWGLRTYMIQFMKKGKYGELITAQKRLSQFLLIEQCGMPGFHHVENGISSEERSIAEKGLARAQRAIASGRFQIVILDEINTVLHFKIISLESVLRLLANKPPHVELVLTGRFAPPEILNRADLITEMREVRHYYQKGVLARLGIEK